MVNSQRARPLCFARRLQTSAAAQEDVVLLDIAGARATITLNNSRMGNALSADVQHSLISRLREVNEEHKSVRAVVLTGRGKLFCTGMNLSAKGETLTGNHEKQYSRREHLDTRCLATTYLLEVYSLFEAIETSSKPTIALINGPCYGAGNGLAMACEQ